MIQGLIYFLLNPNIARNLLVIRCVRDLLFIDILERTEISYLLAILAGAEIPKRDKKKGVMLY